MNDIITNGTEIKQRIISEINNAKQCIYLAMAWFTDRDIANAFIEAKNRNVTIEIILSSNAQNETVKQMFREENISVHSFETGDVRGLMHHKFCLIDHKISINGSFNYSYNASNNNVENVQVSDDFTIYKQFLTEFERLKYNIDNKLDLNVKTQIPTIMPPIQTTTLVDSFSQQLSDLVYISAQLDTEVYKMRGYEKSKESEGNIDVFKAEYNSIKDQIRVYATDDGLSSKKSILSNNINIAFENKKTELEEDKQKELKGLIETNNLKKNQLLDKISLIKNEKSVLESGNLQTGEKGLLQINTEIEKNKLERNSLEQSFVIKKFWAIGTIFGLLGLCVFTYYLSVFFASAMYKVFFEGNVIRAALEAGGTPALPQLVDANALLKIYMQQGTLFGIMATLFFLIPVLLSNLKLIGSKTKWVNMLCFWVGLLVFDILVATMVAINTDEIKSLLVGEKSQLQIWEVVKHGEFWLIFVFGMLPLIITHFLINYITNAYKESQRESVDAEKARKIKFLDLQMIELNADKAVLVNKIKEKDDALKEYANKILELDVELNDQKNHNEKDYADLLKNIKTIFDGFNAKIISGKIFTDEILNSIITAFKSGFIEFLPKYYAEDEVTKRVRAIELLITNNNYMG